MKRIIYFAVLSGLLGAETLYAQKTSPGPYANIGNGGEGFWALSCRGTFAWRCVGWIGDSLSADDSQNDDVLVERLSNAQWEIPSVPTRRKPKDKLPMEQWPVHTIQSMPNPQKIKLSGMSAYGLVVARIIADPTGAVDSRYGIGGLVSLTPNDFSSTFYMVVKDYKPQEEITADSSRPVATWSMYHVRGPKGARRLVKVGNSGSFRWCRHTHMKEREASAAQFITCTISAELDLLRADASFMSFASTANDALQSRPDGKAATIPLDRLLTFVKSVPAEKIPEAFRPRILVLRRKLESGENPAWVTCGVGCCTADEALTIRVGAP